MDNKSPVYINITAMGIVKIILVFIVFYFLFLIRDILAILFISLVLASAVDPWVDWMQNKKIPRGVGIILIYLVMFGIVGSVISLIIPPIITQVNELIGNFPQILEKIISGVNILKDYSAKHGMLDNVQEYFGTISSNLQVAAEGLFSTVSGVVGGIFTFFLILVITFYMVVEENAMKKIVWSIAP